MFLTLRFFSLPIPVLFSFTRLDHNSTRNQIQTQSSRKHTRRTRQNARNTHTAPTFPSPFSSSRCDWKTPCYPYTIRPLDKTFSRQPPKHPPNSSLGTRTTTRILPTRTSTLVHSTTPFPPFRGPTWNMPLRVLSFSNQAPPLPPPHYHYFHSQRFLLKLAP